MPRRPRYRFRPAPTPPLGPTVRDLLDPRVRDLVVEKPTASTSERAEHPRTPAKSKSAKGRGG